MATTIIIPPGEHVDVKFDECDGMLTVLFGENNIRVEADLPDSAGRRGVIYCEQFGEQFGEPILQPQPEGTRPCLHRNEKNVCTSAARGLGRCKPNQACVWWYSEFGAAAKEDAEPPAPVRAEVRDWASPGFRHRVVAYGEEGPWAGYDDVSLVVTPYGTFISFRHHYPEGTFVRVACVSDPETVPTVDIFEDQPKGFEDQPKGSPPPGGIMADPKRRWPG